LSGPHRPTPSSRGLLPNGAWSIKGGLGQPNAPSPPAAQSPRRPSPSTRSYDSIVVPMIAEGRGGEKRRRGPSSSGVGDRPWPTLSGRFPVGVQPAPVPGPRRRRFEGRHEKFSCCRPPGCFSAGRSTHASDTPRVPEPGQPSPTPLNHPPGFPCPRPLQGCAPKTKVYPHPHARAKMGPLRRCRSPPALTMIQPAGEPTAIFSGRAPPAKRAPLRAPLGRSWGRKKNISPAAAYRFVGARQRGALKMQWAGLPEVPWCAPKGTGVGEERAPWLPPQGG